MCKLYKYKVVREDLKGNRRKRTKTYWSFDNELNVGGLYAHLGSGFPGLQRVLSMTIEELPE